MRDCFKRFEHVIHGLWTTAKELGRPSPKVARTGEMQGHDILIWGMCCVLTSWWVCVLQACLLPHRRRLSDKIHRACVQLCFDLIHTMISCSRCRPQPTRTLNLFCSMWAKKARTLR
jgi:hypothetical protein